ncbi:MAG: pilus assembly protein TadG-related protein [Elusimicrobiota bacterium]
MKNLKLKIKRFFSSPFTLHPSRSRGQAMPYFFMMMVVLVLCWAMIVNIAKLVKDRMMMQNAADNAALSAAIHQARTINMLGQINKMVAKVFYDSVFLGPTMGAAGMHPLEPFSGAGGGVYGVCALAPLLPQMFKDDVTRVGATVDVYPMGLTKCSVGTGNGSAKIEIGVKAMKAQIDMLIPLQKAIAQVGPLYSAIIAREVAWNQERNAAGDTTGADTGLADVVITNLGLGLKRNEIKIEYFGAEHTYISIPPIPIVLPPGLHVHYVKPYKIGETKDSWYYADEDNFYKKKIKVIVRKNSDSPSNKGYPLIGKWFGIDWPAVYATASAGYYNTKGPSFVLKSDDTPKYAKIKENIDKYDEAETGGWDAHLIPVGTGVKH